MTKTNLQKILSIAGQSGLFKFVAQANSGVVVESLSTGKRSMHGMSARLTSLSDISIYTEDDELPLLKVLESMKEHLGESDAPTPKSKPEELKEFFANVIPDYDRDRFYLSHMKKIVDWYNYLKKNASLDFEVADEKEAETSNKEAEPNNN